MATPERLETQQMASHLSLGLFYTNHRSMRNQKFNNATRISASPTLAKHASTGPTSTRRTDTGRRQTCSTGSPQLKQARLRHLMPTVLARRLFPAPLLHRHQHRRQHSVLLTPRSCTPGRSTLRFEPSAMIHMMSTKPLSTFLSFLTCANLTFVAPRLA